MSTLNVSNIINAWVENELHLTATIYNDVIPDNANDAICLRYDPAPAAERRYQDGTRLLKWNLAYYVRNKKRDKARSLAAAGSIYLSADVQNTNNLCPETDQSFTASLKALPALNLGDLEAAI